MGGPCPGRDELIAAETPLGRGCIRADWLAELTGELHAKRYVDRAVLELPLEELVGITLSQGERKLALERSGRAWQELPARRPVDDEALRAWARDLTAFAAEDVVAAPPREAPPPGAPTVELRRDGAVEYLWLEPAAARDRVLVRRPDDPAALVVHRDVARLVEPDPVLLASREVLDVEPTALRAVEIVRGGVVEKAERGASLDDWQVTAPVAVPADADTLAALREAAAHLHATRVVTTPFTPAVRLTLVFDPPPTTPDAPPARVTLELSAPDAQGECLARKDGAGPTYQLPPEACAALGAYLPTHALWAGREAIAAGGFAKHGPGWYGPDGARLSDATAAKLLADLAALGAPAEVVGYGEPAGARPLVIRWTDGTSTELRLGRGEYGLAGRAVRYRLPTLGALR